MVKTKMENENQTKIDEFKDEEIVEKEADERTKTSQIKKLKYIGKLVDEMITELEPKTQPEGKETVTEDKPSFGMNFGYRHRHRENKLNFGSKDKESKPRFGFKSPEKKPSFGYKHTEKKPSYGSKNLVWKPKPKQE